MSDFRVNEDIFIDETLATCAEYQPFIDEMRALGRFHQPDHWTSYQFRPGQELEPILGVRHSDAVAFCEWLTGRSEAGWKSRLPTCMEAEQYPLPPAYRDLGYWVTGTDDEEFSPTWSRNPAMEDNILKLPAEYTRGLHRDIDLSIDLLKSLLKEIHMANIRLSFLLKLRNFMVLRERLAGRSQACEGIRLVRERVR